jgi:predicted  nucleic acid-binding Zn-ribbon protein
VSALKAERQAQLRLLDLQDLDSTLDQLRHRRRNLPELARIRDVEQKQATLADSLVVLRTTVDDLARDQRKADTDVEQARARQARDQERLDQGQVGSPKELERLQHELQTLDRRISDLEDAELEVMEQLENAEAELAELEELSEDLGRQFAEYERGRDEAFASIDTELEHTLASRDRAAAEITGDLVALYERLRANHGGVGAAELTGRRCGGCRLELNAADLRAIAAAAEDEVVRCEECGRILVRTGASGV